MPYVPLPVSDAAILDRQSLTAQATLTTAPWAANAWSRIEIELFGLANAGTPANSFITMMANADNSTKYGGSCGAWTGAFTANQDAVGTATSATVAFLNTTTTKGLGGVITIFPKTVAGRFRSGFSSFSTVGNNVTVAEYYGSSGRFVWTDTTTDWTFATIVLGSSATFTGTMIVRGML